MVTNINMIKTFFLKKIKCYMQSYIVTAWQMFGVIIILIYVDSKSL